MAHTFCELPARWLLWEQGVLAMDLIVLLAFILAAVLLVSTVALVAWNLWPRHSIADEAEAWLAAVIAEQRASDLRRRICH
jgi:uncharacterized membrane protein YqjE